MRNVSTLVNSYSYSFSYSNLKLPIVYSIGEMHIIKGTYNISVGFRLDGGTFYSSIGTIGTISTNGILFIPLVFYW